MTNPEAEVMMETAHKMREEQGLPPEIEPGEFVEESLPDPDFSKRAAVQSAKQNLNQRLREAERKMLESELLSRGEEVLSGNVQRVDRASGDAVVDVARVECLLAKEDMLPREMLKIGDRVQALIKKINTEGRWPHIRLTRKHPRFLAELFRRVVPEIEKGVLEIVHTVRDPGNRAKIAVKSNDPRVDPGGNLRGDSRLARASRHHRTERRADRYYSVGRRRSAIRHSRAFAGANRRNPRRRRSTRDGIFWSKKTTSRKPSGAAASMFGWPPT